MAVYTKPGAQVFAPTDNAGNPRSVDNGDAQVWATEVERQLALSGEGYAANYETRAQLYADLAHPAGSLGRVFDDSNSSLNGVYKKSGASGAGSWTRIGPLAGGGALSSKDAVGTADIENGAVSNAKQANMAAGTVKMRRPGAGTGAPTDTTLANLKTDLGLGGLADKDTAATEDLDDEAVTFAKMQPVGGKKLIGRDAGTSGAPEEIGVGDGLEFDGANNLRQADGGTTNAKLANMETARIKGRVAAGTGAVQDLTPAQVRSVAQLSVAASNIASASSIDLAAASGDMVRVTGTTKIDALGAADAGLERTVIVNANGLVFGHSGALILPGDADLSCNKDDLLTFRSLGSGNWILAGLKRHLGARTAEIADKAATNSKLADMASATIKGRVSNDGGTPEDLTRDEAREVLSLKPAEEEYFAALGAFSGEGGDRVVMVSDDNMVIVVGEGDGVLNVQQALSAYFAALGTYTGEGDDPEAAALRVTDDNYVLQRAGDSDGVSLAVTAEEPDRLAYADDGMLRIVDLAGGNDRVLNDDADKVWLHAQTEKGVAVAVYETDAQRRLAVVGLVNGDFYYPMTTINLHLQVGQSNGQGSQAPATVELLREDYPYPRSLLMAATPGHSVWARPAINASVVLDAASISGFEPLRGMAAFASGNSAVEFASMRYLTRADEDCEGRLPTIIVGNMSVGAHSIERLSKNPPDGETAWDNLETYLARVGALAAQTRRAVLRWLLMHQGESNTATADLGARHDAFRADAAAFVEAELDQPEPVRMISWQPASYVSSIGARSILTHALDVVERYGTFWCGGPCYPFPFAEEFLHHSAIGHALRGEMDDEIIRRVERGEVWTPLHMVSVALTGANEITVTLSEAAEIDEADAFVAPVDDAGITLAGGDVADIAVSGTSLVITTTGAASSVTAVQAAMTGQSSPRTEDRIPRTNIRAAVPLGVHQIVAEKPMHKWLCAQELSL